MYEVAAFIGYQCAAVDMNFGDYMERVGVREKEFIPEHIRKAIAEKAIKNAERIRALDKKNNA